MGRVSLSLFTMAALSASACSRQAASPSTPAIATAPVVACEAPTRVARRVSTSFETQTLHVDADARVAYLQGSEELLAFDLASQKRLWLVASLESPDVVVPDLSMSGSMSALRNDGTELVTVQTHGQIATLDAATGRVTRARTTSGPVRGFALAADGRGFVGSFGGSVRMFDGALAAAGGSNGIDEEPKALATSGDGSRLLVGGKRAALAVVAGSEATRLRGHRTDLTAVAVSVDGARGLSGDHNGRVLVWDLSNNTNIAEVELGSGAPVGALAFAADGTWFAAGDAFGKVQLHRTSDATLLREISLGDEAIRAIRSPGRSCSLFAGLANGDIVALER